MKVGTFTTMGKDVVFWEKDKEAHAEEVAEITGEEIFDAYAISRNPEKAAETDDLEEAVQILQEMLVHAKSKRAEEFLVKLGRFVP